MVTRDTSRGTTPETAVYFYDAGGHSHDGENSSLIDATKYSMWDFSFNTVYSNNIRAATQARNIESFKNFIVSVVNNNVLSPAGITLGENVINGSNIIASSITGDNIAAGTITGDRIAANTITSTNVVAGSIVAGGITLTNGDYWDSSYAFRLGGPNGISYSGSGNVYLGINAVVGGWSIGPDYIYGGDTYLYSNGLILANFLEANFLSTGSNYPRITLGANVGSGEEIYFENSSTIRSTLRNPGLGQLRVSMSASYGGGTVTFGDTGQDSHITCVGGTRTFSLTASKPIVPASDNATTCGTSGRRWSDIYATSGIVNTSDSRAKRDIKESSLGLDFINILNPVSYKWIVSQNNIINEDEETGDFEIEPVAGVRDHFGLIAQEVKSALDVLGCDSFGGWVLSDINDPESDQGLRYHEFISPIIKAIQELSAKVDAIEARLS